MKRTLFISQPHGIGDILFIQKIILHYANLGFQVVVPIWDKLSWMLYYIVPHENVEYPLLSVKNGTYTGNFKFSDIFFFLNRAADDFFDPESHVYKSPVIYNAEDPENSVVFLALGASYIRCNDKMMPSKYNFVGMDFSDWVKYVHLKRRPHVERELYYDVLGLKDDSRYTLVNEHSSRSSMPLPVPGNVIHLRQIEGFTLFDWSLVIEKSTQIVTIDTSLVLLTEVLKQQKPLYMISRYEPPSFDALKDILTLDWNLVLTPKELNVAPVV